MTSQGAQFSTMMLQMTMEGIPEIIGVLGAQMLATYEAWASH